MYNSTHAHTDSYVLNNMYGAGTGPIHLDDVQCTGIEASLLDCPSVTFHNCQHFEDVSIGCKAERELLSA